MKKFILPLVILVLLANIGIFALRFSAARSRWVAPAPAGEGDERETLKIFSRRIKTGREGVRALLEERDRIKERKVVGELVLRGILYYDDSPLALINEEIVREGDKVGEVRVIKIKAGEVLLLGETLFTLLLVNSE